MEPIANPSFPPELCSMVVEALYRRHLPYFEIGSKQDTSDLPTAEHLLRMPSLKNIDQTSRATLKQRASRAILTATVFSIGLQFERKSGIFSPSSPPFLQGKEHAVHYLEVVVPVQAMLPREEWQRDLCRAIEDIGLLRSRFSGLKHCVLSVLIKGPDHGTESFPGGVLDFAYQDGYNRFTTIRAELAILMGSFSKHRPGQRRSVRIRYCSVADGKAVIEEWGPLVNVDEETGQGEQEQQTVGAQILDAAFRRK